MSEFRLPDLGEGLHEAEIIAWHVGPGDHVVADQPLVTVETDKAVVEIPSPRSGHIAELHAGPGDILRVGDLLVAYADAEAADVGAIVGDLARPPAQQATPAPSSARPGSPVAAPAPPVTPSPAPIADRVLRAAPAVRAHARAVGVDLSLVRPTGVGGTITRSDVDAAAAAVTAASVGAEPLRGVRRAMAANMARAHAVVVPATVTDAADIGDWEPGQDPTIRLVRAVGVGCVAEPALNVTFHGPEIGRTLNDRVDLGVAVDTDDGLFVPVLHDVTSRSMDDLRQAVDALKADVVARTVPPEQLRGQTITLSNFGMFGGRHGALVIVPPQVAIVGAGRIEDAVVARRGQPVVRAVLPLSLTFDHRVVMGGEAARFLTAVVEDLERPS